MWSLGRWGVNSETDLKRVGFVFYKRGSGSRQEEYVWNGKGTQPRRHENAFGPRLFDGGVEWTFSN
jgi:hypothetical protein